MQNWRTLAPMLKVSRKSLKPNRLQRNLVLTLTTAKKIHRPKATLFNNAKSEGRMEFPDHQVKFYQDEASLDKVPGKLETMTSKQKLDFLVASSHSYRDESAQHYKRDENKCQQPGFTNITAIKGKGLQQGTREQKMLSAVIFSSYLFCLMIYPYLDLFLN